MLYDTHQHKSQPFQSILSYINADSDIF